MNDDELKEIVDEADFVSSNKKEFYKEVIKNLPEPVKLERLGNIFDEVDAPISSDDSVFNTYINWFTKGDSAVKIENGGEEYVFSEMPSRGVQSNLSVEEDDDDEGQDGQSFDSDESLNELVQTDVDPYIPRKLVNGDKDVPTLKKVFRTRPEGHPQNVLMVGPTGGGKTHAIKKVSEELGQPMVRVNLNRMTTIEDFVGQWVPDEEDGGFKWQDGVLPRLMKNGGILVVDEINAAPPEILFVLHSALDFREITLTQKDGEVIKADNDFWVIGAMNPDYRGTQKLNEALKDRFELVLNYPYDKKVEKQIIEDDGLRELASKLRDMKNSPTADIVSPCSTRMMKQFERNREAYGYELAKHSFINKFEQEEQKAVEEAMDLHLEEE